MKNCMKEQMEYWFMLWLNNESLLAHDENQQCNPLSV